ncbi:MAG: hypothetical protein LBS97_01215 [Treponema sp.]|nr:hypothetical protein [Treponema sp.]
MKKQLFLRAVLFTALAVCAAMAVIGCTEITTETTGAGGLVQVNIGGGARTILPDVASLYYTLTFEKGDVKQIDYIAAGSSLSKTVKLAEGTWDLEVAGYASQADTGNPEAVPVVIGSKTGIIVTEAGTTPVAITLGASTEGAGNIAYTVVYPDTAASAAITASAYSGVTGAPIDLLADGEINTVTPGTGTKTSAGSIGLDAGYYKVTVIVKLDDGRLARLTDIAHVYNNLSAALSYTLAGSGDGNVFAPLPDKTALTEKLIAAEEAKTGVVIGSDANSVDVGKSWVTQAAMDALNESIAAAAEIKTSEDVDQGMVDKALADLTDRITAFNNGIGEGTKPADKTGLTTLIEEANGAMNGVVAADDAESIDAVPAGTYYVPEQVMKNLRAAIETAEGVVADNDANQAYITVALVELNEALSAFNAAKVEGTGVVRSDKAALNEAIKTATAAKTSIVTSTDAKLVAVGTFWVTEAELGTLNMAIAAAQEVSQNVLAEQGEVDAATDTLTNLTTGAIKVFNDAKKSGERIAVTFTSAEADGSATATTTKLTLTFSQDITGLSTDDISITANATGTTKGVLTAKTGGVYELTVTGLELSGSITVKVEKYGYAFTPLSQGVAVFCYTTGTVTIEIGTIVDHGLTVDVTPLEIVTLSRSAKEEQTFTVTTAYPLVWLVDGVEKAGSAEGNVKSLTVKALDFKTIGGHYVTVIVTVDGKDYSVEVPFVVAL